MPFRRSPFRRSPLITRVYRVWWVQQQMTQAIQAYMNSHNKQRTDEFEAAGITVSAPPAPAPQSTSQTVVSLPDIMPGMPDTAVLGWPEETPWHLLSYRGTPKETSSVIEKIWLESVAAVFGDDPQPLIVDETPKDQS